jgi:hypothetical protein
LIDRSLRKLGVGAAGQQLDPTEYADGLEVLRVMLDAWSLEDLLIPFQPTETFDFETDRRPGGGDLGAGHEPQAVQRLALGEFRRRL